MPQLVLLDAGALGRLRLEGLRETGLRAARLARALFGSGEADVVAVQDGRIWRASGQGGAGDDAAEYAIVQDPRGEVWIADAAADALPGGPGVRFCAAAPIRLSTGAKLGALRIVDHRPRAFDPDLMAALQDLAAFVAGESERLLYVDLRRARELFDAAPGFMFTTEGPDHVIGLANAAYQRLVRNSDLVGRRFAEALPAAEAQGFVEMLDRVFSTGEPHVGRGAPVTLGDPVRGREVRYLDFVVQPIREPDGRVSGLFCQGQDITQEKLATQALEANRAELEGALAALQAIFDYSHDVICSLDAEGRFLQVGRRAEAVWGYAPKELVGRAYQDFLHADDREATARVAEEVRAGRPATAFRNRYVRKDGSVAHMLWSVVWSAQHRAAFGVARDMREVIEAEERLLQAQKLEALGRLTGGVAHDFNNLLTAILAAGESLAEGVSCRPDLEPLAETVVDAAEKGADLVRRLLSFARRQPLSARPVDCGRLLSSAGDMLRRTLGDDVEVSVEAPQGVRCLADPAELTSALLNLCINARDAMPDGGRLTLRAEALGGAGQGGGSVQLSVTDTGHGMTDEVRERALEPFFTTKPEGEGTGLGLSTVFGFVSQSGGRMDIQSRPGEGSTVSLILPAAGAESDAPESEGAFGSTPVRILLVEDNPIVRDQTVRQLASLGHEVIACGAAKDALDQLARGSVDLLMTDMVMPGGMNGRQLADHALLVAPGLRVLFTSGYTEDAILRDGRLPRGSRFLPKPYRRADLARLLQSLLADD